MIEEKMYQKYKFFVIFFSTITFIFSIFSEISEGYRLIPLLVFLYLFLFITNPKINFYSQKYCGMLILNVLMFLKYSVAPFCIILNKDFGKPTYTGTIPSDNSCITATWYIIIEMTVIFFIIFLLSDKIYKKYSLQQEDLNAQVNQNNKNSIIFKSFLSLSFVLAIYKLNLFLPNQLMFIDDSYLSDESSGFITLLFSAFKLISSGLLIEKCISKYIDNKKFIYIFYSYIIIFIYIILSTSTSRINMIIPLILFVMITNKTFKKRGTILLVSLSSVIIVSFISITIYKSFWLFNDNESKFVTFSRVITSQIQEYTSNIRPVAQGIEAIEKYGQNMTYKTLMNDFIGSIPIINKLIDSKDKSNVYYNRYILGNNTENTPMIIPLSVISTQYFSEFFNWILSAINIIILMLLDSKMRLKNKTFLEKYISIYLLFVFAYCINCNIQIIVGRIFTIYLPVAIICYLEKKIKWGN